MWKGINYKNTVTDYEVYSRFFREYEKVKEENEKLKRQLLAVVEYSDRQDTRYSTDKKMAQVKRAIETIIKALQTLVSKL